MIFLPIGFLVLVNIVLLIPGCLLEGTTILLVVVLVSPRSRSLPSSPKPFCGCPG